MIIIITIIQVIHTYVYDWRHTTSIVHNLWLLHTHLINTTTDESCYRRRANGGTCNYNLHRLILVISAGLIIGVSWMEHSQHSSLSTSWSIQATVLPRTSEENKFDFTNKAFQRERAKVWIISINSHKLPVFPLLHRKLLRRKNISESKQSVASKAAKHAIENTESSSTTVTKAEGNRRMVPPQLPKRLLERPALSN